MELRGRHAVTTIRAGHDPWASHRPWPAPPAAKAPRRWSLPLCRAGTGTLFPLAPQGRSCRGAALTCRSIVRAIAANILPGGSVAVTTLYVSAARVKSTLTLSSSSGPLIALSGSSNCCGQWLARSMCPCARHMVRTAAAKAVSNLNNV